MRSKNDAKRWVEKAKQFYKYSGKRIALAEFTNPTGPFVEDEMYIFALSCNGTMLAHGINEKYVGEEFIALQDSDGKPFISEIVQSAKTDGNGWMTYTWHHPLLKKWLPKTVYFEKVDELIICSGVYDHSASVSENKAPLSVVSR
ncbi:MAG: cache domain-containing protein [Syntrophobacteraceae bacterium]|jgi:signal transduction histidine kinase